MKSKAPTVTEYMKELPDDRRKALSKIRFLIKRTVPYIKESMKYGLPHYALDGPLYALASQKHYMALYVTDVNLAEEFKSKLPELSLGKSCVRFKKIEDLPLKVVEKILKTAATRRIKEVQRRKRR